jgi:hypothetical protein
MMIPAAMPRTTGNPRRTNVNFVGDALIGLADCTTVALRASLAAGVHALAGSVSFAVFLIGKNTAPYDGSAVQAPGIARSRSAQPDRSAGSAATGTGPG